MLEYTSERMCFFCFKRAKIFKVLWTEKDVYGLILWMINPYTSYEYKVICESNEIQISVSRKETLICDFPIESCKLF